MYRSLKTYHISTKSSRAKYTHTPHNLHLFCADSVVLCWGPAFAVFAYAHTPISLRTPGYTRYQGCNDCVFIVLSITIYHFLVFRITHIYDISSFSSTCCTLLCGLFRGSLNFRSVCFYCRANPYTHTPLFSLFYIISSDSPEPTTRSFPSGTSFRKLYLLKRGFYSSIH